MSDPRLRYSEIFFSTQGEGKFVGVPSVFLRTFGCNFRCRSFGRDRNEPLEKYNPEVKNLLDNGVLETVKRFEDLPLVHTGCDTYASIYPEFKKYMQNKTIDEVVEDLINMTPEKCWSMKNGQDIHLILTGGEPMLWQKLWPLLLKHPRMHDLKNLTIETNATQKLQPDFEEWLFTQNRVQVTFSCSPKLSVSGESWNRAILPDVIQDYYAVPNSDHYLKFVVSNEYDLQEVEKAVEQYQRVGIQCAVYLMPVGGRSEEYKLNEQEVARLSLKKGWRFSPRLHIQLYGNNWGT